MFMNFKLTKTQPFDPKLSLKVEKHLEGGLNKCRN